MSTDPSAPIADGHTVLGEYERAGLIPSHVATHGDLYEVEQRNILQALLRRSPTVDELLDDRYLRGLHEAMFGDVWSWAGNYRTRTTNLGISFEQIPGAVRSLFLDVLAWVENGPYPNDEIGVRFHHRLVAIHPFPNGNGRHGRIAADYLVDGLGGERFSWGAESVTSTEELRSAYLGALRSADKGEISELLAFARS